MTLMRALFSWFLQTLYFMEISVMAYLHLKTAYSKVHDIIIVLSVTLIKTKQSIRFNY
jgi:hypothetical protein